MGNIELYMEKYFGINDEVSPTKSEKIWASIDYSYSDFIDKCDERGVSIDDIMKENNTYKKRENALLKYTGCAAPTSRVRLWAEKNHASFPASDRPIPL